MITAILTFLGILIYLIHLWLYGVKIHKVIEERDFWREQAEIADKHTQQILDNYCAALNRIPLSIRNHYANRGGKE
jgi:hypothetical protein